MKHSPEESDLYKNFKPSKFSGDGFLGDDDRSPQEIISADQRLLEEMGITAGTIADSLAEVYAAAADGQGLVVEIRQGITAVYHESRGRIPSPFRGEGTFEKGEVVLTDQMAGRELVITRLSLHLIRKHCFFQGRGSRFRIEPAVAAEMLNLL